MRLRFNLIFESPFTPILHVCHTAKKEFRNNDFEKNIFSFSVIVILVTAKLVVELFLLVFISIQPVDLRHYKNGDDRIICSPRMPAYGPKLRTSQKATFI